MHDSPTSSDLSDTSRSWWSMEASSAARNVDASPETGLSDEEAARRRDEVGPNELIRHERRSAWSILVAQFKSLIVGLLAVAAIVAFLFGEVLEVWAIVAVIILNTGIGFFSEWRAVRSMEALFEMGRVRTRVRRDGAVREVNAEDVVPGDILVFEGGDVVTADVRLLRASNIEADESTLTGESVPVSKDSAEVAENAVLAERTNMLYKGTSITRGSGEGVVVATGMRTELGSISALVGAAEDETTPLEKNLARLGRRLILLTIMVAVMVTISGLVSGRDLFLMIETGIALAVAAIPEGLPIVATIALARGLRRMARQRALINRLASVETLGSTNVIFTDKTGTLTENRMTVARIALESGDVHLAEGDSAGEADAEHHPEKGSETPAPTTEGSERDADLQRLLEVIVLCNNASISHGSEPTGDPMEVALLVAAEKFGVTRSGAIKRYPLAREEAFDSDLKMMATVHEEGDTFLVAVKGAPGAVVEACSHVRVGEDVRPMDESERESWIRRNDELASQGYRMLAVATKQVDHAADSPYDNLEMLGLVALLDPPRTDVREAIEACHRAGIRVVMVTGDQKNTAVNIARQVGLIGDEEPRVVTGRELQDADSLGDEERGRLHDAVIFARVSPSQKLDLISLHQERGSVVAMTGDGVNDAPALKKADIGMAMGKRGTQVAREAADMVLQDDSFATIVAAIRQGRNIFGNIRRFVYYLLSCNLSEVLTVGAASLAGMTLPILPLQILYLNLITDVFPALALGVGEGDADVMNHPPRKRSDAIMGRRHWLSIGMYGAVMTVVVLASLLLAQGWLQLDTPQAVTVSFLTLALSQLWHVFNMRSVGAGLFKNEVTRNPYVWGAVILCLGLLAMAVFVPILATVLELSSPGAAGLGLAVGLSLMPLPFGIVYRRFVKVPFS